MATTVEELITKWGFNIDMEPIEKMERGIQAVTVSLAAAGAAAAAAATAIFGVAKLTANAGEEALHASEMLGVSVEAIQEIGYAAKLENVSMDELRMGFVHMARAANEATGNASGDAAKAFRSIGISIDDLKTKKPDQLFEMMADGMQRMQNPMQRLAIGQAILGRSSAGMTNFLHKGSKAMEAQRAEARELGFIFSHDAAESADNFNDSLDRLHFAFEGLRNSLGNRLIPILTNLADRFLEWYKLNKAWIDLAIAETFQALSDFVVMTWDALRGVAATLAPLIKLFGGWGTVVRIALGAFAILLSGGIAYGIGILLSGVYSLIAAWTIWDTLLVISTLLTAGWYLLIGAGIIAIIALMDDLVAFFQGRDSFTGVFLEMMTGLWNSMDGFFDSLGTGWQALIAVILTPFRVVMGVLDQLMAVWNLVSGKSTVSDFANQVAGGFSKMLGVGSMSGGMRGAFGLDPVKQNNDIYYGKGVGPMLPGGNKNQQQTNNIQSPITINVGGTNATAGEIGKATEGGIQDAYDKIMRGTMNMFGTTAEAN